MNFIEVFKDIESIRVQEVEDFIYFHLNDSLDTTVVYCGTEIFSLSYLNSEDFKSVPNDDSVQVNTREPLEMIIDFIIFKLDRQASHFRSLNSILNSSGVNSGIMHTDNENGVSECSDMIQKLKKMKTERNMI